MSGRGYQQGGVAVSPDGLVHRRQSVFGSEVDVGAALHQHPDGLAAGRLALHRQRQRRLCRTEENCNFNFS